MEQQTPAAPSLESLGYYDERQLAEFFRLKQLQTVRNWRSQGKGPPFVKLHGDLIAYPIEEFKAWLANRIVRPGTAPTLIDGPAKRGRPAKQAAQK